MKTRKTSLFGVPTVPLYLLVAVVTWLVLVLHALVAIPLGGIAFLVMRGATIRNPHWFESLCERIKGRLGRGA